jgi:hypothetical protein
MGGGPRPEGHRIKEEGAAMSEQGFDGGGGEAPDVGQAQDELDYMAPGSYEAWQADMAQEVADRNPGITEPAAAERALTAAGQIAAELAGDDDDLAVELANHPLVWELGHRAQLAEAQAAPEEQAPPEDPGERWAREVAGRGGSRVLPFG